jgi:hypothetical protein
VHNLEFFDGKKWNRAKPGYPGEVFGVETSHWKAAAIPPNGSAIFYLIFSQSFYHVQKGEKLRLIIDFWSTEESMRNGKPDGSLVSPEFVCP